MNMIRSICAASILTTLVIGCSGEAPTPGDEAMGTEVAVQAVTSVELGGAEITFLQAEGSEDIIIQETVSSHATRTPMSELGAQKLTSLEVFTALAPTEVPPEELVAAHAREVEALGRTDSTLIVAEFDLGGLDRFSKSVSPEECDDVYNTLGGGWVNRMSQDNLTGNHSQCAESSACFATVTSSVLLAACNSDSSRDLRVYRRKQPLGGQSTYYRSYVAPDTISAWFYYPSGASAEHQIYGRPTSSTIVYHLRTGIKL